MQNTLLMEECDIVTLNLGLHYSSAGDMVSILYGKNKFRDDFRAAITYLADFDASRSDRIAIWR